MIGWMSPKFMELFGWESGLEPSQDSEQNNLPEERLPEDLEHQLIFLFPCQALDF